MEACTERRSLNSNASSATQDMCYVDAGRAVCDPIGVHEQPENDRREPSNRQRLTEKQRNSRPRTDAAMQHWRSSLAVTAAAPPAAEAGTKAVCVRCKGDHTVTHCQEFASLPVDERASVVRQHGLCWACLRQGHIARKCPSRQRCTTAPDCTGWHHPLLHGAPRVFPSQLTAAVTEATNNPTHVGSATEEDGAKVLLQILPLQVSGPCGQRTVNVMLDLGSQITLITEKLANDLGVTGPVDNLRLSTVSGTRSHRSYRVEFDLQPRGSTEQFRVRDARTTPVLNITGPAVNWPAIKTQWPHLCDLDLPGITTASVDILLGSDVLELIVPRAVREGPAGSPWAVLTRLGWVATGKLPAGLADGDDDRQVNHVKLMENQELHEEVTNWWKTEAFGTKYNDAPNRCTQDKTALDLLDSTTKRAGDRYETGLLWKSPEITLNGNVSSALSRLKATERKLDRDSKFSEAYCATLNDYIDKGYARKLTEDELKEEHKREWYLPHHAVFNVNKPGKLRVVFDAAARHDGTSLNQQLLAGPDLTNSMIGILLRFRQRPVALAADINAMFHQDEHPDAADAVRKRFYVDDYLDSVEDEKEAIELRQSLSSLLSKGGFSLSKWASSSQEVLQGIEPGDRSVTSRDLGDNDRKCERALGVHWDTLSDELTFRVTSISQPVTKRGILSSVSSIFDPLGVLAPWVLTAKCLLQSIWRAGYEWDQLIADTGLRSVWKRWTDELSS
ncbi:uncharacterized protein LOC122392278 [Amphibalanus amphitrite]|uniref:uncharacterized protein LOC122384888 n=1 Tax=Amphibalanus amphitrite TaxID=1232801 RepID=UPI001C909C1E|nr:uncharacterized protein LOC122384888 [Amphibalanus amphitrite]XP_043242899.1 uncharacterized protein LOC122392278 [Amphibalanus amphitrite]